MKTKNVDYISGKLFPMILKFSIPAAVSLLITAIYNIVDRIFVGNFNGFGWIIGLFSSFIYDDGICLNVQCRRLDFIQLIFGQE